MVGLGSVTEDVEAVLPYLRAQGLKVGLVAVKLLQPFPEAELVAALAGKQAVTVLERSDQTALTSLVTQALFKARENADTERHPGIPPMSSLPTLTTAIFGLGGHDLQPRHLIAACRNMADGAGAPLVYLGSQFFEKDPAPETAELQQRLRAAYPETELMALETGPEPRPASPGGPAHPVPLRRRLRHHRHRQAAHRHPGRRPGPALQVRAQVRLGEERRPDQLLHHPQPGAGEAHQRRARGRRDRDLPRPQGLPPHRPAAGPGRGRHLPDAVRPGPGGRVARAAPGARARRSAARASRSTWSTPSRWPRSTRPRLSSRPG